MKNKILILFIILLNVNCKKDPQYLVKIEGKQLPISAEITAIKTIEDFIQPYKEKVETEMNTALSYTTIDLVSTDGELESSLGNLMADMCYKRANPVFNTRTGKNIDFAMFNFGGIRAGISKGVITTQNAFNLMPFENSLVVVEMTAEKVTELAQYLIDQNKAHPLSKQIKLTVKATNYDLTINKIPLDNSKTYFVLTSDYLQNGGDNMLFFKDPLNLFDLDYKVRNSLIDYFKENDTVKVKLEGRFTKE